MRLTYPIDWLQDKVERACHWFQKMTGLTNYWIYGKVAIVVAFCIMGEFMLRAAGMKPIWVTSKSLGSDHVWKAVGFLIIFLYLYEAWRGWQIAEDRAFRRLEQGLVNPKKMNRWWRFFSLCFCWCSLYLLCVTLIYYLEACDPLPPCQGKIREWWHTKKPVLIPIGEKE